MNIHPISSPSWTGHGVSPSTTFHLGRSRYVRNTTARAFAVVASALGIPSLLLFLRAVRGGEGMIHGFLWEMAIEIVDLPMKNGDLCDFPEFLRYVIPEGIATIPRIWMKSLKWKSCYLKNFTKIWVIVGCETPKKDEEVGDFLRFLRWNPNILFVSGTNVSFLSFVCGWLWGKSRKQNMCDTTNNKETWLNRAKVLGCWIAWGFSWGNMVIYIANKFEVYQSWMLRKGLGRRNQL